MTSVVIGGVAHINLRIMHIFFILIILISLPRIIIVVGMALRSKVF